MSYLLAKPVSKIEYAVHLLLFVITGGVWLLFIIARVIIYKRLSRMQASSSKNDIMRKVNQINSKQKGPSGTLNYIKRTFTTEEEAEEDDWYEFVEPFTFEIVGESYKRGNLLSIIEKNNAFQAGVLELDALLKLEPDNKFDPTAVAVTIEGKPVGYVSSDLSLDVTSFMDDKNVNSMKLKARIGWDTSNPEPAIGVRLDFNF